jgi:pimeloyl-ACP methyl ester carboxylesterase
VTPRVRFCTGEAGRRIAYAVHGSGPPLVCAAWWVSHLEEDWRDPDFARTFGALGERFTVVRYDRVGVGLSDRNRERFDLDAEVEDLSAVADHLDLARFSLMGFSCGGPPAVIYAADHPERVERLVLYASFVHGAQIGTPELRSAVRDLVRAHWGIGSRAIANLFAPDLSGAEIKSYGARQRAGASAQAAARLLDLTFAMDAREPAGRVRCPTLVVHRREDATIPFECGRRLAAAIPGAELVPLEGKCHVPWRGDGEAFVRAVTALAGAAESGAPGPNDASGDAELERRGNVWEIAYGGRRVHVEHVKGLGDLALLLAHPGRPIHAVDLARGAVGSDEAERELGEPVLDERARREIAARVAELEGALDEADAAHDLGRLDALRAERESLLDALGGATGLGGRERRMPSAAERARKAVSARLRDAIGRIARVHPELGRHLERSVHTGARCSYEPDSDVVWRT